VMLSEDFSIRRESGSTEKREDPGNDISRLYFRFASDSTPPTMRFCPEGGGTSLYWLYRYVRPQMV